MITLDTILVIANEKFLYKIENNNRFFEKSISYFPAVYLKERFFSSVNINYRGLLFNQISIQIQNMDITDPQTGHHNFNIPLNSFDISYITLKNSLNFSTYNYSEKLNYKILFGENKEKPFYLIEAKYKNLSLSHLNNFENGHYYQMSLFFGDYGFFGFRRNDFDATGFFSNPSILPFSYETTTVFLGILNYKNLSFLFRNHFDVFVYDYKKNDTTIIKNLKNEHSSLKIQINYKLNYKNMFFLISYKRDFLSSNTILNSLNKPFSFRNFIYLNPEIIYKNFNLSFSFDYWIEQKIYLLYPNLNLKIKNFSFSINSFSRYPNYLELYYKDPANVSNENLKPEFYISPEISYENNYIISKFFYRYNYNVIDWVYNIDSLKYFSKNLEPIHSIGFEITSKEFYLTQIGLSFFKYLKSDTLKYKYLDNTPQFKFLILNKFFALNLIYNEKIEQKLRAVLDIKLKYKFILFSVEDLFEQNYINEWISPKRRIYLGIIF